MQSPVRILGVDPGSHVVGLGLIEVQEGRMRALSHGVIDVRNEGVLSKRLAAIAKGFSLHLIESVPHIIVLEKIFLGKNVGSAFTLGHARGVIVAEAARNGISILEYEARVVKKGIAGNGNATKEQVQRMIMSLLKVGKVEPLDASDALGLACHHAMTLESRKRFGQLGIDPPKSMGQPL